MLRNPSSGETHEPWVRRNFHKVLGDIYEKEEEMEPLAQKHWLAQSRDLRPFLEKGKAEGIRHWGVGRVGSNHLSSIVGFLSTHAYVTQSIAIH